MQGTRFVVLSLTMSACGAARPATVTAIVPPAPSAGETPAPSADAELTTQPAGDAGHASAADAQPRVCGRMPSEPVVKVISRHSPGGRCSAIATTWANVAHQDRVCRADADCTVVFDAPRCHATTLNVRAAALPKYGVPPCGNPAAGVCGAGAAGSGVARCDQGCCVLAEGGFGSLVPHADRRLRPPGSHGMPPAGPAPCSCSPDETCCAGGMAGSHHCTKLGPGQQCPPLP